MKKKGKKSTRVKRTATTKKREQNFPVMNIGVVGIGGGGGNAVARMSQGFSRGVEFIAINTDHQDLDCCEVRHKIYIGKNLTKGLGTGMDPDLGHQAAEENRSEIGESLQGVDLVFLAAGFGGGTGTGAAPVVAEVAKQAGALTLAFVTKPFAFEGGQRARIAQEGISKLKDKVDALIVVPNEKIFSIISKDTPILKAFEAIDDVLKNALHGIVDLIMTPGIVNLDFADVRSVLQDSGTSIVGMGLASGQDRAVKAVEQALSSPLLEVSPEGAKAVLMGVAGSADLKMSEVNEAAKVVAQTVDNGARIIFGAYRDRHIKPNQIKLTVVASGFNGTVPAASSLFGQLGGEKQEYEGFKSPESSLYVQAEALSGRTDHPTVRFGKKGAKAAEPAKSREVNKTADDKTKKGKTESGKKKEEDVYPWDIPAFLRRKKR